MPVATTDTAAIRAEKAFAAYLRDSRDANADDETYSGDLTLACSRAGVLNGVAVHEGRQTQSLTTPAIVVYTGADSRPIFPGHSIYEVSVEITLATGFYEGTSQTERQHTEALHAQRAKALDDLICDESTLKVALNKPPHPQTDSRHLDEFFLQQSFIEQHGGDTQQKALIETWTLTAWCAPWDAI